MFQLARIVGRISPFSALRHNFSVLSCTSKSLSSASSSCKCRNCMKLSVGHGNYCRCVRCYSTGAEKDEAAASTNENTASSAEEGKKVDDRDTKIAQLQDSYLRCLADMENLRQRTKKEVDSASSFAIQKFCKDIVSVADVLELALGSVKNDPRTCKLLKGLVDEGEAADTPSDSSEIIESVMKLSKEELANRLKDLSVGLSLTLSEMIKVFARHGITAIDPLHQKFDPNYHMALYEVENPELDVGTVVSVQKKGYLLNHRVIRPANVGVSKKDAIV